MARHPKGKARARQEIVVPEVKEALALHSRKRQAEAPKNISEMCVHSVSSSVQPRKNLYVGSDKMTLLQNSAQCQVCPGRILGNTLEGTVISVKLFYTPYDICRKVQVHGDATFDLYETLVGANGLEYQLVAMGNTATKALELLERFAGKVVTLRNVRAKTYQDFPQLQLLDDFEILPEDDSRRQRGLTATPAGATAVGC